MTERPQAQGERQARPADEGELQTWSDNYFRQTRSIIEAEGANPQATYAVFMRTPILAACRVALEWLRQVERDRATQFEITERYNEGDWVGAGEPLLWISGPFAHLVELETFLLQKIGAACVAAHNAYRIAAALPKTEIIAMDARHCAGVDMAELMAYAAAVGSTAAQTQAGARGFVGSSTDGGARAFNQTRGLGTMPHALIGYAGSTLAAAEAYDRACPDQPMTVLVDYFGREISDALEVAAHFSSRAKDGSLAVRIDIPGSRFMQGLDPKSSYDILERNAPGALRGYLTGTAQRALVGPGTSAAAIWHLRETLDANHFQGVKIVASSGFNAEKCEALGAAAVPLDRAGTGSFLPERWSETFATADVVAYNGKEQVKFGREFLLPSRNQRRARQAAAPSPNKT